MRGVTVIEAPLRNRLTQSVEKEKEKKINELEAKKLTLDDRHHYVISLVSIASGIDRNFIISSLIEKDKLDVLTNFFTDVEMTRLIFLWKYKNEEHGITSSQDNSENEMDVDLLSGHHLPVNGKIFYIIKTFPNIEITSSNIHEVTTSGCFDVESPAVFGNLRIIFNHIFHSVLKQNGIWTGPGDFTRSTKELLYSLELFMGSLKAIEISLTKGTVLKKCEQDLSSLRTLSEQKRASKNHELVISIEHSMKVWIEQIAMFLAETSQVYRETEDMGPQMELQLWKCHWIKFSYLLRQIRVPTFQTAVTVLKFSHSKMFKMWQESDGRLFQGWNEAKECVKYLEVLVSHCKPLYISDPVTMVNNIPALLDTISIICNISSYFNSPNRIMSIFSKITNQMIISCKIYVSCDGKETIWSQPKEELMKKINSCHILNQEYQSYYRKMKEKSDSPSPSALFCFSEMFVFGKFDMFCNRLQKISKLLDTISYYSDILHSNVEGILTGDINELEETISVFESAVKTMKGKKCNFFDYRDFHFNEYYSDFMQDVEKIKTRIVLLLTEQFKATFTSHQAIKFLIKLEKIQFELDLDKKYQQALLRYNKEIDMISQKYQEEKDCPSLLRICAPVAGKISWSNHLLHRIEEPIRLLTNHSSVLKSKCGNKILKKYNKLKHCLMQYKMFHHETWMKQIPAVEANLHRKLFLWDKSCNKFKVNENITLWTFLQEADQLCKMGLEITELGHILLSKQNKMKKDRYMLLKLLTDYEGIKRNIPVDLKCLAEPHLQKVDNILHAGRTNLTWSSLNISAFIDSCTKALYKLSSLITRAKMHIKSRINDVLTNIANINLFMLFENKPESANELLLKVKKSCANATTIIQNLNMAVEVAVIELIELFLSDFAKEMNDNEKSPQEQKTNLGSLPRTTDFFERDLFIDDKTQRKLSNAVDELIHLYTHHVADSVTRMIQNGLETLYCIVTYSTASGGIIDIKIELDNWFLFKVYLYLQMPNIVMEPDIDIIQRTVNQMANAIFEVAKSIAEWKRKPKHWLIRSKDSDEPLLADSEDKCVTRSIAPHVSNLYRYVAKNQEIARLRSLLSNCLKLVKEEVKENVAEFSPYCQLLQTDKNEEINAFILSEPTICDFEAKIKYYKDIEIRLLQIPDIISIKCISMFTENLKTSFYEGVKACYIKYGNICRKKHNMQMKSIFQTIDDLTKKLGHVIYDLDDVQTISEALAEARDKQIDIELNIELIEECYDILNKFCIPVKNDELDRLDSLQHYWKKLYNLVTDTEKELASVRPHFKALAEENIKTFFVDCDEFCQEYEEEGPMVVGLQPKEALHRLTIFQNRFDVLWQKYSSLANTKALFGVEVAEIPKFLQIKKELGLLQKLYILYKDVINSVNGYYDILWSELNIEKIITELLEFQNRCRKLPKGLKEWPAFISLKKTIDDFNELCPLLELMTNTAMKHRHWEKIGDITGRTFNIDNIKFCLKNILEAPLLVYKEDIEDVCISAQKEKDIEAKLQQITIDWEMHMLTFTSFKNRGELLLRGDNVAEIISLLEDSLTVLSSLLSNRYNAPFRINIEQWIQDLSTTNEVLETWLFVQNLWIYLEAVFIGGDIAKQLPKEAKRFEVIDKSWVKIIDRAHECPNVIKCCAKDSSLKQLLFHLQEELELCQKSLTGYLEKKRLEFPRFFFISDPALLEILGQASDSHSIEPHLLSIFDNTKSLVFDESQYNLILSILSSEGESVMLDQPVLAEGNVEKWLMSLLQTAQRSLHNIIRKAADVVLSGSIRFMDFLNTYLTQVGILGLQFIWTREAENAMYNAPSDKKIMKETNEVFLELLNRLIDETTRDLEPVKRIKYETLITIHVHQRDIFNSLYHLKISSPFDFEWQHQCRFYFKDDIDKTVVSITDVNFIYQNEFLGCTERLVITPLTDRCYVTLAQALNMCMGGLPAGPAGTGKTETTKDMGKTLGKYVVVFNCSDQMDYRGLGRIFKGLAQSGTWGCFDEFNRIDLPVLSVAAQQIAIILTCKKEKQSHFVFSDGDTVAMNNEFGIFLTMNPGYAGRQELPENLKVQFRTVAMMVPDRQIIIRVKLASCGFLENVTLARKFYTLYNLCEEQLTKQVHYDFGLRNILSVLRTLGATKRQNPDDSEDTIVMHVLKNMNLSKLIDEDEPLFSSLINDLFPGIYLKNKNYPELQRIINEEVEKIGLICYPSWILKLIQLYETQLVRHGIMILGPSGAGKTVCIQTLIKALNVIDEPHREMRMNPKSITAPQMFGRLDVTTNDWTDGIFSALWRKTSKVRKNEHIWLVLDGPVDAIWIENLNSVLDDNKTLTLANGDRIPMSPNCKILFEVDNIDNASPATVSRNGIVYMSSSCLTWKPVVEAWLNKRLVSEPTTIIRLFNSSFHDLFTWANQNLTFKIKVLEINVILQALILLEGLLPQEDKNNQTHQQTWKKCYTFVLMWSIGALLELDDRARLEVHMQTNFASVLDLPILSSDSTDTIFDYWIDQTGCWQHWKHEVETVSPKIVVPSDCSSVLIPNIDNVRTDFLIHMAAKQNMAVLLIGEPGTAKTVMIQNFMRKYNTESHLHKTFNFSYASTPFHFQHIIESYIEKRMGTTYGPHGGKKMTVFIDDINMPVINEWGDQVTNEIVRQTMEMKGFYSLEKPGEFINVIDMQFLAAMCQPGGGRNDIPSRLKRQFVIFNCTLPSDSSVDKIFDVISSSHFCIEKGFTEDIQDFVQKFVPLTRKIWQKTKLTMLPTPANFHYIFNLRDLSRIWQGMTNIQSSVVTNKMIIVALWKHECLRVIADRFTTAQDLSWFESNIKEISQIELKEYSDTVDGTHYFADFLREAPDGMTNEESELEIPKIYEPVSSLEMLEERLKIFMTMYNEMIRGRGLNLVFFEDAVIYLLRISRILRTVTGNALLVGVGGSGKQSLTKLASFIAGYKTFQITLTRAYNVSNLLEDLKNLYRTTGIQDKGTTFIFTEQDLKEENFLEYLNNILSSGMISNLFNRDEQSEIVQELSSSMKREFPRRPLTQENVFDYFVTRAQKNLHIVLCFSPVGEKLRTRALKFPGLISGCTINWFQPWPKNALIAVAKHYLSDFDIICKKDTKQELEIAMGSFHDCVANKCVDYIERYRRFNYVTPKSYLSFICGYKTIYKEKYEEIHEMATRMEHGLSKLEDASVSVECLKKELAFMEKELEIASVTAEQVLDEVTIRAEAAEKIKNNVEEMKNRAQVMVNDIGMDKAIAEEKLELAKPALEQAEAALNTIKPSNIATVRKLSHPPHLIMRIMDCVLILFQRKLQPIRIDPEKRFIKPSWEESLKFMSSTGFLQALQTFPKDSMNDEVIELLSPYFEMKDYNMNTAKRVCGDVAGLLSWTQAMASFYSINKEVLPLKANLEIQEARLEVAMEELHKVETELADKEQELNEVRAQYEAAISEKQRLLNQAEICRKKMLTATMLITELAGEFKRWTEESLHFKVQIERLIGDTLLATGFLSYSGPFNQEFRNFLLEDWIKELTERNIPFTKELNITEMLIDNATIALWNTYSLPNDDLSIQNGIIVTKASCYPLLIDPQGQGKQWIKNKEERNNLQITSLDHKQFRQQVEKGLSYGYPLLIEDVGEELDPMLDNVLEKNFIKSGTIWKVLIGDRECDVTKGFTLYITTKLPNPRYSPEISARMAIIDFTVTVKGLEDQLLGRVILTEKAELENKKLLLIEEIINNKKRVQELEDNLLTCLTSTEGSLIDDENLIVVLQDTKKTAHHVSQNLLIADETQQKINSAREEFRPVATRGSILYFLLVEMSVVNSMYQTSLKQFLALFDLSIARSEPASDTHQRTSNIIAFLTYKVYKYSLRSFYVCHRFLFTLLLALKIDMEAGTISHAEFVTFIKGGASFDLKGVEEKPFSWILDTVWLNLVQLNSLPQFSNIITHISMNEKGWKDWLNTEKPEEEIIPDDYHEKLTVLEKLLLIRTWCPDRTISQARKYITASLGEKYTEGVILDLESTWKESNKSIPLIGLLSVGADPTSEIEMLAKKHKFDFQVLSMGQGQEIHARRLLNEATTNGGWLLLQNCHLSLQFSGKIFDIIQEMENCHPDFRLWITTESHTQFPISLLQSSIKFTNEPPQGIKASLKRTYIGLSEDVIEYNNLPQWRWLLFSVAFLHTVVQERRKYGSLGWNIPYEFNQADFLASIQFLQKHIDDADQKQSVCWKTIRYMIGGVQYGGRVTDDFDKLLLTTYTNEWFTDELFEPNFSFYPGYKLPHCISKQEHVNYINSLPSVDVPGVFGLHSNADITYQINMAQCVFDSIQSIQPKDKSNQDGETRESMVYRLSDELLNKLPEDYVQHEVKSHLEKMGSLAPMNIFLHQELERMQKVITIVREMLVHLKLAIEGAIIMNENLQDAFYCIYDAQIPVIWKKISWESSTLGFWFTELLEKDMQFRNWCFQGRPNLFWMAGFFNPQGFLTAMRQEITRVHHGWALDTVIQRNTVTNFTKEEITRPPQEGVYIYGLFLEGASWNKASGCLTESIPKILYEQLPVVHIFAVSSTAGRDPKLYECPIYKKLKRTDYIGSVDLKTNQKPTHWTLRGVALLCDTK